MAVAPSEDIESLRDAEQQASLVFLDYFRMLISVDDCAERINQLIEQVEQLGDDNDNFSFWTRLPSIKEEANKQISNERRSEMMD